MGMKPRSPPQKEPIYLKSRNRYLNSYMCVFSIMNLMCYTSMHDNETSSFGNRSLQSCSRHVIPCIGFCMWNVNIISSAYTIGLPSSLYALTARRYLTLSDRLSCLSAINFWLSEVFFHLQYKIFQNWSMNI